MQCNKRRLGFWLAKCDAICKTHLMSSFDKLSGEFGCENQYIKGDGLGNSSIYTILSAVCVHTLSEIKKMWC